MANLLTGFVHTDKDAQSCTNVYPGDSRCRVQQPHSKWHEESANGLTDLAFLADALHAAMSKPSASRDRVAASCLSGWGRAVRSVKWW